jgi:hypothetical protein
MLDIDLNLPAKHDFDLNELPNEKDEGLEERELHEEDEGLEERELPNEEDEGLEERELHQEDEGLEERELPNEENEGLEENQNSEIRQEVNYMLQIIVPKYFE